MNNDHQFQPDPKFFARTQLLDDMLNYRKTDHVPAAPMIQYLPIYLYGDTTVQDVMMDYGKAETALSAITRSISPILHGVPNPSSPERPWTFWIVNISAGPASTCQIQMPHSRCWIKRTAIWDLRNIWNMQRILPAL